MTKIEEAGRKALQYPNVTGFSKTLRKRIKDGEEVDELCLQIHVSKKLPPSELKLTDILPTEIDGFPVDVVEYGELSIPPLLPRGPEETYAKLAGKTSYVRPLVGGLSIGNLAITAGTLGGFVTKSKPPCEGAIFIASNAHVLTDDPSNNHPSETRIIQPGRYDGGSERDKVGSYFWHKPIIPYGASTCSLSNSLVKLLNILAASLHRKSRFYVYTETANKIDFAVSTIEVDFTPGHFDKLFNPLEYGVIGYGFAGSDSVSLVCKAQYVESEGYRPAWNEVANASIGDQVEVSSRSCFKEGTVLDDSAYEIVNYGSFAAAFDDIIITSKMLNPGDSGSEVYKKLS